MAEIDVNRLPLSCPCLETFLSGSAFKKLLERRDKICFLRFNIDGKTAPKGCRNVDTSARATV